jgi:hypothetical protein
LAISLASSSEKPIHLCAVAHKLPRAVNVGCEYSMSNDQETEIRQVPAVFPQEKSEDG